MKLTLNLNIAPVAKGRPRFSARDGYARVHTPRETRRFEKEVARIALAQWKGAPIKSAIKASLTFYMQCPSRRPARTAKNHTHPAVRPDWDNLAKGVCDAANGILWVDDGQLTDVRVLKVYTWDGSAPRIEIEVESLE